MAVKREQVFKALFDLTAQIKWSNAEAVPPYVDRQFITRSRRLKLFNQVAAQQQPALYQVEHDENIAQNTGMPYKQTWMAEWYIYQCVGKDPNAIPTVENNLIIDACFEALRPRPYPGVSFNPQLQTLGGLVSHCWIDGNIFKDPGDIDNQGMIVIPIKMLVPN